MKRILPWLSLLPTLVCAELPPLEAPPSREAVLESIEAGIDFLLGHQNPNGSFGTPRNTKGLNIYAPVPGAHRAFRTAISSLSVKALLEAQSYLPEKATAIQEALAKGEAYLLQELPRLRRADQEALYNIWGHSYGLESLALLHQRASEDSQKTALLGTAMAQQIDLLGRYEYAGGGWGYYDFNVGSRMPGGNANSFTTATALLALQAARQQGAEVPQDLIEGGIRTILRQQNPDLTYAYSEPHKMVPRYGINRPAGSLARSQACNLALFELQHESVQPKDLREWLTRLYTRSGWLDIGRKRPVPHEAWFAIAGYFYYYGQYYGARSFVHLSAEERPLYQQHLALILLELQEEDGSWWDFPFYDYHRAYGTSFALMSLVRCL
ncbi:MAG: hypothetical protein AAF555_09775 [Verrucomicrobiota bacterium]